MELTAALLSRDLPVALGMAIEDDRLPFAIGTMIDAGVRALEAIAPRRSYHLFRFDAAMLTTNSRRQGVMVALDQLGSGRGTGGCIILHPQDVALRGFVEGRRVRS